MFKVGVSDFLIGHLANGHIGIELNVARRTTDFDVIGRADIPLIALLARAGEVMLSEYYPKPRVKRRAANAPPSRARARAAEAGVGGGSSDSQLVVRLPKVPLRNPRTESEIGTIDVEIYLAVALTPLVKLFCQNHPAYAPRIALADPSSAVPFLPTTASGRATAAALDVEAMEAGGGRLDNGQPTRGTPNTLEVEVVQCRGLSGAGWEDKPPSAYVAYQVLPECATVFTHPVPSTRNPTFRHISTAPLHNDAATLSALRARRLHFTVFDDRAPVDGEGGAEGEDNSGVCGVASTSLAALADGASINIELPLVDPRDEMTSKGYLRIRMKWQRPLTAGEFYFSRKIMTEYFTNLMILFFSRVTAGCERGCACARCAKRWVEQTE